MESKGYRKLIRQFLKGVEWANGRNVSFLIHGKCDKLQKNWADCELLEMLKTKTCQPCDRIKKLFNENHHIYATISSKKKDKGNTNLDHDLKLRDVLAKYMNITGNLMIDRISVRRIVNNPDAHIGNLYFELDNGHENDSQLREKLVRYSGRGNYQVIFIMAHRFGDAGRENARLDKLMEIGQKILGHKPNRILASTYHGYLEYGKLYNLRGIETCVSHSL